MEDNFFEIPNVTNYKIDKNGQVFSLLKRKILKPSIDKQNGYLKLRLLINGEQKTQYVHMLLALSFINNENNYPCVNHKDGNKLNNSLENLEWCSYYQNNMHALKTGLRPTTKGVQTWTSKLSEQEVLEIRRLHGTGVKRRVLSKMFNTGRCNITQIVKRITWRHI